MTPVPIQPWDAALSACDMYRRPLGSGHRVLGSSREACHAPRFAFREPCFPRLGTHLHARTPGMRAHRYFSLGTYQANTLSWSALAEAVRADEHVDIEGPVFILRLPQWN